MMFDQMILFFQEWWPLMALIIAILLVMSDDLFPKLWLFIREVEQRYPNAVDVLFSRQEYVIDCYDRLPVRIRSGFTLIGGKQAWTWVVRAGYAIYKD